MAVGLYETTLMGRRVQRELRRVRRRVDGRQSSMVGVAARHRRDVGDRSATAASGWAATRSRSRRREESPDRLPSAIEGDGGKAAFPFRPCGREAKAATFVSGPTPSSGA